MFGLKRPAPSFLTSLSARLLVLTVLFVMLAEFLIWTPSVARYRKTYLEEHIAKSYLSLLALDNMPGESPSQEMSNTLLFHTDAYGIVLHRTDRSILMLDKQMPPTIDATYDLREATFFGFIVDAFMALVQTENRVLRITGVPPKGPQSVVEVVIDEAPMRQAMLDYSTRILNLSIIISLFTAMLVYLSLQWLMVRPMRRITESMAQFRDAPELASSSLPATTRADEIGIAQRELAVMQEQLRDALRQKDHLAALGAAVAKINHDLRNTLATAMLVSDRLADSDDPDVQKVAPRLYTAIDRAINLCSDTLNFASEKTPELRLEQFRLVDLVDDVAGDMPTEFEATCVNRVSPDITMTGDYGMLRRAVLNLVRNAAQAGAAQITIAAATPDSAVTIDVGDDGPGMVDKARQNLFQPFTGSARKGGTGLGLPIVMEIIKAHGGTIQLIRSDKAGTLFRIDLPRVVTEKAMAPV